MLLICVKYIWSIVQVDFLEVHPQNTSCETVSSILFKWPKVVFFKYTEFLQKIMPSRDFWSPCGWTGAVSFRADKGWAMKRARPDKKVRCGLGSNYGLGKRRLVSQLGIYGKWVVSLKGFVNRLPHDCHKDNERDVSTAYCRSSSVFHRFNNQRK